MSKLWIVHRQASLRGALARLTGVAAEDLVVGAPTDDVFSTGEAPAALVIGFEDDFEHELAFLHRHDARLHGARRRFLVAPGDAAEVARLVGARADECITGPPEPRALRDFVLGAVAHRRAEPLAARLEREHLADRFAHWFGEIDVPGLLRALDPAIATLPLLVRGPAGSGRGLVARYVERFRLHAPPGQVLRIDARDDDPTRAIAAHAENAGAARASTWWIDEADQLAPSAQRRLADWIRLGPPPGVADGGAPRWVVTAGARDAGDRLEPALASALAPLVVEVPALWTDHEAIAAFATRVATDWAARFGGPERTIATDAIEALAAIAWVGDRVGVEGALRLALSRGGDASIRAEDLDADTAAALAWRGAADSVPTGPTPDPPSLFAEAPIVPAPETPTQEDTPEAELPEAEFADETPPATSEAVSDLERAFAEGERDARPAANDVSPPGFRSANGGTERSDFEDPSREMSDESFARAGTDDALSPVSDRSADPSADAPDAPARPDWRRLARSLSHEIRNPLVTIRTFTQLLPENFEDASFRERFTELVGRDVDHIDAVIDRLAQAAEREKHEFAPVDVSEVIERLLDARRTEIGERRLLVLRELERDAPIAWADAHALEIALAGLLDRALAALPERGDLFVATRRIERGPDGAPRLRVLLRHHGSEVLAAASDSVVDATLAANAIEYVLAETIVEASGGRLTIDATDARETLILVDLLTPGATD